MVTPIPRPGPHGGDGPAVARALGLDPIDVLDLSLSLNPCAPDITALAARHLESLRHYPDPTTATRLLAEAIGVDSDRLVLTNGGAEAISLARRYGARSQPSLEFAPTPRWIRAEVAIRPAQPERAVGDRRRTRRHLGRSLLSPRHRSMDGRSAEPGDGRILDEALRLPGAPARLPDRRRHHSAAVVGQQPGARAAPRPAGAPRSSTKWSRRIAELRRS